MARVAYTVTATLPDEQVRADYEAWLLGGHVQLVIEAGASTAQVIRFSDSPIRVQSRYEFPSEEAFQGYLQDHAPRLRPDGIARFGSVPGVSFAREVGTILD